MMRSARQQQALAKSLLGGVYTASGCHTSYVSTLTGGAKSEQTPSQGVHSLTPGQLSAAASLAHRSLLGNSQTAQLTAGARSFASGTEVSTSAGENSWSKFRAPYGREQKSSLSAAMYVMIGVFGFGMYLNDMIYHPPRVVAIVGLMMLLMYVRRS